MSARVVFPADPAERRRLWREMISMDQPAVQTTSAGRRATPPSATWVGEVIDAPESVINGLRRAIAESLTGDQLTQTDRTRLIVRAERLGLTRFEANLLIAAVIHRATPLASVVQRPRSKSVSIVRWLAIGLILETAIVAALIVMMR